MPRYPAEESAVEAIESQAYGDHAFRPAAGLDAATVDLRGTSVSFASLRNVDFEGSDLRGAHFQCVDLTHASFKGANLSGARFSLVNARGADFSAVLGKQAAWERSDLTGATFVESKLERASITSCGLEHAILDRADLSFASLAYSNLDGASFCQSLLMRAETFGVVDLDRTDLSTTRQFAYCREMVIEVLRRSLGDDLETVQWLGAAILSRLWCYPKWLDLLRHYPVHLESVMTVFSQYPDSGCQEALSRGQTRNSAAPILTPFTTNCGAPATAMAHHVDHA
ncbi:hypothetical protein acdb102_22620 [Acidothermaceae bacterium B102]|nr:hypothetical protein acdb102_22620 [Acidothermaceae bacterium B102]